MYEKIVRTAYCPICDKEMWFETNSSIAHCPICNHHLNPKQLDEPVEDCLTVVFDYSTPDMATMVIARENADKLEVVNSFIGGKALEMYMKLIG